MYGIYTYIGEVWGVNVGIYGSPTEWGLLVASGGREFRACHPGQVLATTMFVCSYAFLAYDDFRGLHPMVTCMTL